MKKQGMALFLPFFVMVTLIALLFLAYAIGQNNAERKGGEWVGQQAVSMLKIYDEGARAELFLEQALKYSMADARRIVAENGGYAKNAACQRLLDDPSFVLLNSCPSFSPERAFATQWNISLREKLQFYESMYVQYADAGSIELNLEYFYMDQVQKAGIVNVEQMNKDWVVELSPLMYLPELVPVGTRYTVTPKFKMPLQDFAVYDQAFSIAGGCVNKKAEECHAQFHNAFPQSAVVTEQNIIKVSIPDGKNVLKFAFDRTKVLPFRAA